MTDPYLRSIKFLLRKILNKPTKLLSMNPFESRPSPSKAGKSSINNVQLPS